MTVNNSMDEQEIQETTSSIGFQTIQLCFFLFFGVMGLFSNISSTIYFIKNFTLKKTINTILLMDCILCIFSFMLITVVVLCFLFFPEKTLGKLSCYLLQLSVSIPVFQGSFFVLQIALLRKFMVTGANTEQKYLSSERMYKIVVFFLTTLPLIYQTTISLVNGPCGIVYQVGHYLIE